MKPKSIKIKPFYKVVLFIETQMASHTDILILIFCIFPSLKKSYSFRKYPRGEARCQACPHPPLAVMLAVEKTKNFGEKVFS
jgi:hypothetical protein